SSSDQADWFRFSATAGVTYTFHTTGGSGDTVGGIYSDANGVNFLVGDDDSAGNGQFSVDFTPTATGTYYLWVSAYTPGDACSYSLQYRSSQGGGGGDDNWDPGD